jgi:hypothetical protein
LRPKEKQGMHQLLEKLKILFGHTKWVMNICIKHTEQKNGFGNLGKSKISKK